MLENQEKLEYIFYKEDIESLESQKNQALQEKQAIQFVAKTFEKQIKSMFEAFPKSVNMTLQSASLAFQKMQENGLEATL